MSVLDTINQNNVENLKKEEAEKIETFDTNSKIDVVFDLFMHAFFNNVIKEGNLKKLKGYIFVGLNNSKITKHGLKYLSECDSNIDKPYILDPEYPHWGSMICGHSAVGKIAKCGFGIWFPLNCVMFDLGNELKHGIFPRIDDEGFNFGDISTTDDYFYGVHEIEKNRKEIYLNNGYIRLKDDIHGRYSYSNGFWNFDIAYNNGGIKYENNNNQISYIKSKFETTLRAEGINLDKIKILKTSNILYHQITHFFKPTEIESYSPDESKCIYFEISW